MSAFSWLKQARSVAAPAIAVAAVLVAGPGAGAAAQQPVDTRSMPDPGVTLYNGNFYAFSTGGFGLWESTAPIASGPWTAPANVMNTSGIPAWIDTGAGIWAPDMIQIPDSGEFVVYFSAQLNPAAYSGTRETPASGARCIGAAESSSPKGPFTVQPNPWSVSRATERPTT